MIFGAFLLLATAVLSQQPGDTEQEVISRSIHKDDYLEFSVPEMFPYLVKDPVFTTLVSNPKTPDSKPDDHSGASIITLQKQLELYFQQSIFETYGDYFQCSNHLKVGDTNYFLASCGKTFAPNILYLAEANFMEQTIVAHSNFTVPEDEEIIKLTVLGDDVLFLSRDKALSSKNFHLRIAHLTKSDKIELVPTDSKITFAFTGGRDGLLLRLEMIPLYNVQEKFWRIIFHEETKATNNIEQHLVFYSIRMGGDSKLESEGMFNSTDKLGPNRIEGLFKGEIFLALIPAFSDYLMFFKLHNDVGMSDSYAIKMCSMTNKTTEVPLSNLTGTHPTFSCTDYSRSLGYSCNPNSLSTLGMDPFYTLSYSNSIHKENLVELNFTLVTNCKITGAYCMIMSIGGGKALACRNEESKLTSYIEEAAYLDQRNNLAYYLVKQDQNSTFKYLMTFNLKTIHCRIFSGEKIESTELVVFFDKSKAGVSDKFLKIRNKREEVMIIEKIYDVENFREQKLIINLKPLPFHNGTAAFKSLIIGESSRRAGEEPFIKTYELKINVSSMMTMISLPKTFGHLWIDPSSGSNYTTILPFDSLELKANDPLVTIDKEFEDIVSIKSQRHLPRSSFIFTNEKRTKLNLKERLDNSDQIEQTLVSIQSVIHFYKNSSLSLEYCATDQDLEFICRRVFMSDPLNVSDLIVVSFYAVQITKRAVIIAKSPKGLEIFQVIRGKVYSAQYEGYDVSYGEMLYRNRSAVFVGRGAINGVPAVIGFEAPLGNNIEPTSLVIYDLSKDLVKNLPTKEILHVDLVDDGEYAFAYNHEKGKILIAHCNIKKMFAPSIKRSYMIDGNQYMLLDILADKLLVYHRELRKIFYIYDKPLYRERYIGELPVEWPFDTSKIPNFNPLEYIDSKNFLGVVSLKIIYEDKIYAYKLDLRFRNSHPLERLRVSYIVMKEDPADIFFSVLDIDTFSFFTVLMTKSETKVTQIPISYPKVTLEVNTKNLPLMFNTVPLALQAEAFANKSVWVSKSLQIVKTEFDSSIVSSSFARADLNKQKTKAFELGDLLAIDSHMSHFSVRKPKGMPYLFNIQQPIMKMRQGQPGNIFDPSIDYGMLRPGETIRMAFSRYLVAFGLNWTMIYNVQKDSKSKDSLSESRLLPIITIDMKPGEAILHVYINLNFTQGNLKNVDASTLLIFILHKGEVEKSNLRIYAVDILNPKLNKKFIDIPDFCRCKEAKFEVLGEAQDGYSMNYQYVRNSLNGTTIVNKNMRLVSTGLEDRSTLRMKTPLYKGFFLKPAPMEYTFPISQKVLPLVNSGILKPGANSAMSYFMLEQSTKICVLYTSSTSTIFHYQKFSDTCVLRSDTTVSCRIFEQDMDIGCIVQCDQTRIEAFKLRVKVDEIEGGSKDKLSGVDVIKLEGYKIPVNYSVLHIVKGENLDFVVVNKTDAKGEEEKHFILMYDPNTGLIVYRMPQSEVCKNKTDKDCDLRTTYIYQMNNNRIMIVPKNTPLNETLYLKKPKPSIIFDEQNLTKVGSLDDYVLRIHGLTDYKDIELRELFSYNEDNLTWVYLVVGAFLAVTLIGIFALVLYKNWGADNEEPLEEAVEAQKIKQKKLKESDIQFGTVGSFVTNTAKSEQLHEPLILKTSPKAQ